MEAIMVKMTIEGSFVALITPFNHDGSVDFGAFRTLLRFQEDHGTTAVLFMGSTGEPTMLSPEERRQLVVETARMKTGRMRFFYGCTGGSTEATLANVRFARAHGADGAILAAPPYICASEDEIERFFLEVADATDLPLGIYNNPPRVGTDLDWERLLRLPLLHFTYSATNPVPVKSLMKALGLPAGDLRRPLRALEGPALAAGLAAVHALGLDRAYGYKVPALDTPGPRAAPGGAGEERAGSGGGAPPGAARGAGRRGRGARWERRGARLRARLSAQSL